MEIYVRIREQDINLFVKLLEGFDNLCVVSTLDASGGLLAVRGTPDGRPEILQILQHLPFSVEIINRKKW